MSTMPFEFSLFVLAEPPAGVDTVLIDTRFPTDPSSPKLRQVTSLDLS
jgi:hypothetical protein